MGNEIEPFSTEALRYIQEGRILGIEFSGPTYQIEILDKKSEESVWVFLQFGARGNVKDAFCSCEEADERCVHVAAALLKIDGPGKLPLHARFQQSFWMQLILNLADHAGYDPKCLVKSGQGTYTFENDVFFSLKIKSKPVIAKLDHMLGARIKETPETSLKFSNLSTEEITHWREGRASAALRFELSFWADLAKWLMLEQDEGVKYVLSFKESNENIIDEIQVDWPWGQMRCRVPKSALPNLIATLSTVESPLRLFPNAGGQLSKIEYDEKKKCLHLFHAASPEVRALHKQDRIPIGPWYYVPHEGFYPSVSNGLLDGDSIAAGDIDRFFAESLDSAMRYLKIDPKPRKMKYEMHIDKKGRWHFKGYLIEKGDLASPLSAGFKQWVYLPGKGFFKVEGLLFKKFKHVLEPEEVSGFINQHRLFLNSEEGFSTHLSSLETPLAYQVTSTGMLKFFSKWEKEAASAVSHDYGEWVYVKSQGFFSKREVRQAELIRPGLEISPDAVPAFLKANHEELETIPNFFFSGAPVEKRGLRVEMRSPSSIRISTETVLQEGLEKAAIQFFGDYIYVEGKGFSLLPLAMQVPHKYLEEMVLSGEGLDKFFREELEKIRPFILFMDTRLIPPHKIDLQAETLVRATGGGLRGEFCYVTERGKISALEIYEALLKKRRYLFSEAGCLDLQSERFTWLRKAEPPENEGNFGFTLATLDFMRLDAVENVLAPVGTSPYVEVTKNLLHELRDFVPSEQPSPKTLKSELRLYQKTGLQWLWFLYRNDLAGLLCDEMGLGKTHQAMALMASVLERSKESCRFLVVCPTSVIYHWQDKLETFLPNLKVHVFHGARRSLKSAPKEGVILTSYGIARSEKEALGNIPFDLAVFDEIQIAKNPRSRLHGALLTLKAKMKLGLTGTPIENNLEELKALFDIVLPGYFPSESKFRELFINPIEKGQNEEKKGLLKSLIRPFILRRKKQEVLKELPDKTEDKFPCDLSPEQAELYMETLEKSRRTVIQDLERGEDIPYVHIFSILSSLKQICDHPALFLKVPQDYKDHQSGKWDLFVELLSEAMESEEKVVVFSQYLFMLDIMELYLKEKGIQYAQIRGQTVDRRGELIKFQNDPSCRVFLGSLQAAGLGIDLTAASIVILYDRWWNAARENQAIDRVHRMGQKWAVQVFKLITKGTIEEKIDLLIEKKGRLLEDVVGSDDQATLKRFTREELLELLSF